MLLQQPIYSAGVSTFCSVKQLYMFQPLICHFYQLNGFQRITSMSRCWFSESIKGLKHETFPKSPSSFQISIINSEINPTADCFLKQNKDKKHITAVFLLSKFNSAQIQFKTHTGKNLEQYYEGEQEDGLRFQRCFCGEPLCVPCGEISREVLVFNSHSGLSQRHL